MIPLKYDLKINKTRTEVRVSVQVLNNDTEMARRPRHDQVLNHVLYTDNIYSIIYKMSNIVSKILKVYLKRA